MNDATADPDRVTGAKAIGAVVGLGAQRALDLFQSASIPARKEGGRYVASRAELLAFLAGDFLPAGHTDRIKSASEATTTLVERRARQFRLTGKLALITRKPRTARLHQDVARLLKGKTQFPRLMWPTGAGRPAAAPMPYLPANDPEWALRIPEAA